MIPASKGLHRAIVERRLVLPASEILAQHAADAVARQSRRGWRLDRASRGAGTNIDAIVALAVALDRLEHQPEAVRRQVGLVDLPGLVCRTLSRGTYCPDCRPRNGSTRSWRKARVLVLERDEHLCALAEHRLPTSTMSCQWPMAARTTRATCGRSAWRAFAAYNG
ncbi:MAG: hypothetical protein WBP81_35955 [Solirubrobacteraceae bacterium]